MKKRYLIVPGVALLILYFYIFSAPAVMVTSVQDGDSIIVDYTEKVRLSHIDAPEWDQPWGDKATAYVKAYALGHEVKIKRSGKDRYGRTLAEIVLADGSILNQRLVQEGLAWHYRQYSSDRYYQQLEFEARAKKKGLWGDLHHIAPWHWRRR